MINHNKRILLMLGIMIVLTSLVAIEYYFRGNTAIADESAFIENVSALAFLFAALSLLFHSTYTQKLERINTLFFATTCSLFFIRESKIEDMNAPFLIEFLSDGIGRSALYITSYLALIIIAITRYQAYKITTLLSYLKSPVTKIVIIGCLFLVAGALFEELHFEFIEEVAEMNGALLILLAAIIHHKEPIYQG